MVELGRNKLHNTDCYGRRTGCSMCNAARENQVIVPPDLYLDRRDSFRIGIAISRGDVLRKLGAGREYLHVPYRITSREL